MSMSLPSQQEAAAADDWWSTGTSFSQLVSNSTTLYLNFTSDSDPKTLTSLSSTSSFYNAAAAAAAAAIPGLSPETSADAINSSTSWPSWNSSILNGTNVSSPTFLAPPNRDPLSIVIPITIIYAIILVTGLLGNVVTCIVIVRSRYLHTATNYYLFSLAISDLILLIAGLPVEMHLIWRKYPDSFGEEFCIARGLLSEAGANATVLTITAFTIERYLAICRPFMIQKWSHKLSRVARQIVVIWILSVILAIPQALQLGVIPVNEAFPGITVCTVKQTLVEHVFEISSLVFFVAPMILITVLYILIALTLRNASNVNESKLRLRKSLSNQKRELGQRRVLKMLVAVVAAFFVCWAPFHAQRLFWRWVSSGEWGAGAQTIYEVVTYISGVLYYVATCVNPVLYHIMSLKFRHAFKVTMSGCCSDENDKRQRVIRSRDGYSGGSIRSQGIILPEITSSAATTQTTNVSRQTSFVGTSRFCNHGHSQHANGVNGHGPPIDI